MADKLEGMEGDIQLVEMLFITEELRPASKATFSDEESDAIRIVIRLAKMSLESDARIGVLIEELTEIFHDEFFPDELTKWLSGVIDKLVAISMGEKDDGDRSKEEKDGESEDIGRGDEDPEN